MPNQDAAIPQPHHSFAIDTHLGSLHLQASLQLSAPWSVLFGPSGSGKSSILRSICGLLPNQRPTAQSPDLSDNQVPRGFSLGSHSAGKKKWDFSPKGLHLSPHRRNLAYAPQGAPLFPHLTVRQNIAFPLTTRRLPPQIDDLLTLFDLTPLAHRYPRDLSGGERQRVNLARAFAVPNPTLLLLDEPFTGLDRTLRSALLPRMVALLTARNLPVLSVTHDVEEALLLNAHILRLDSGHITAQGPATEALATERAQILQALNSQNS